MKIIQIATILALVLTLSDLKASDVEEWSIYDLFGLVYHCPVIFTAIPLESEGVSQSTIRRFVIKDRIRTNDVTLPDTINIAGWKIYEVCNCQEGWMDSQTDTETVSPTLNSYDIFMFFGEFHVAGTYYREKRTFYPIMSGVRAFRSDTMFAARRAGSHEPFQLSPGEAISLHNFVQKTYRTIARLDSLLDLRKITSMSEQNTALLSWIKNHLEDLKSSVPIFLDEYREDRENNWGEVQWEVFQWINANGIWQDSWKGMVLSLEVDDRPITTCPEKCKTNAFTRLDARAFLYSIIGDTTTTQRVHDLALKVLERIYYDPGYEVELPRIEQAEIQRISDLMIPLLTHPGYNARSRSLSVIYYLFYYEGADAAYGLYTNNEVVLRELKEALSHETEPDLKNRYNWVINKIERSKK